MVGVDELRALLERRAENVELVRHPPLSEADVAALEADYGALPKAYRDILTEIGSFEDDCGFQLTTPSDFTGAGELPVAMEEVEAFGRDFEQWCEGRDDLFLLGGPPDTAIEKRFPVDMMARFDRYHGSPGLVRIAQLDGVCGDLFVVVAGPTKGTVWFAGDVGVHPEVTIRDGQVVPHDVLSWAVSFDRL